MDYSQLTLGDLLSSQDETIKRGATGILKRLQKKDSCSELTDKQIELRVKENRKMFTDRIKELRDNNL